MLNSHITVEEVSSCSGLCLDDDYFPPRTSFETFAELERCANSNLNLESVSHLTCINTESKNNLEIPISRKFCSVFCKTIDNCIIKPLNKIRNLSDKLNELGFRECKEFKISTEKLDSFYKFG